VRSSNDPDAHETTRSIRPAELQSAPGEEKTEIARGFTLLAQPARSIKADAREFACTRAAHHIHI
jgi:hypothetical protein